MINWKLKEAELEPYKQKEIKLSESNWSRITFELRSNQRELAEIGKDR